MINNSGKLRGMCVDWKQSIMLQLQSRKSVEQIPFEEICLFANDMFDRVDIYKSENIQLNLQREQLQQQLLSIQQAILAGGSGAAKSILSKFSTANVVADDSDTSGLSVASKTLSIENASLHAHKVRLEKELKDLQEKLTEVLKSKSDAVQLIVDLQNKLDEKEQMINQLTLALKEKDRENLEVRNTLKRLDSEHKILNDEFLALTLNNNSLEKKHHTLRLECDALSKQILAVKREDADRLNAENDRLMLLQQERIRRDLESRVDDMTQTQMAKQAAGDPAALNLAAIAAENFETLCDDEDFIGFNSPSKIPDTVELTIDAHEGETCCINWYSRTGPRNDFLATGGSDRKVKIWKIADGACNLVTTLLGSNASITSIDVLDDSILASSNDFATRVWSLNDHKTKRTLTGHSNKVISAKFLNLDSRVASGSADRTIKIWDINMGSCIRTYFAGSSCFDISYNDYQIISGHFDSRIRCWDLRSPTNNEPVAQIVLQSRPTSLDISRDATKLLCSLRDNTLKCIDLRRMEVLQTYSDEKFRIGSDYCRAKFSIDSRLIGCGSQDGSLYLWDTNTAKVEKVLTDPNVPLQACSWSPDGKRMASVERGRKVFIWV